MRVHRVVTGSDGDFECVFHQHEAEPGVLGVDGSIEMNVTDVTFTCAESFITEMMRHEEAGSLLEVSGTDLIVASFHDRDDHVLIVVVEGDANQLKICSIHPVVLQELPDFVVHAGIVS